MATTKLDKKQVILKAVKQLKDSEFGATAIKVELEGQLQRSRYHNADNTRTSTGLCTSCNEGQQACRDCPSCDNCGGDGDFWDEDGEEYETCDFCEGTGRAGCVSCNQSRNVTCSSCEGHYRLTEEELRSEQPFNGAREIDCHNFIMQELAELGLAERLTAEQRINMRDSLTYGIDTMYQPKHPLVFGRFYNDGSVDSEFTFTLMLDDPENIMLLPKVIDVWNKLVEKIGYGCTVTGAGMHMALIREPNGKYPVRESRSNDTQCFANFERNMRLLIPALFFLSSTNSNSRALRYRTPKVDSSDKYSTVNWNKAALEYRVFETCYDNPDAILDNVVVIANTIKYWSTKYISTGIEKSVKSIRFGNDNDSTLHRFYSTVEHVDVLNRGLEKLKPAYYTIGQLKKQRNFDITKRTVGTFTKSRKKQAESEYKEYEERFAWKLECLKISELYRWMNSSEPTSPEEAERVRQRAQAQAEEKYKQELARKKSIDSYVKEAIQRMREESGRWLLEVN